MASTKTCVEIGETHLTLAEGSEKDGKFTLQAFSHMENTPSFYNMLSEKSVHDLGGVLEKLFQSTSIENKNVTIVIPDAFSYSQIVKMPKLKEKELLSAIKYQADQFIPLPLEEAALDIEILSEDTLGKSLLVLIVATSQKLISHVVSVVESAGLIPDTIINELCGTGRVLAAISKLKEADTASVYLSLGQSTSSLYLFSQKMGLIVDAHVLKIGYDIFVKEIKANINVEANKAQEVLQVMGFSSGGSINVADILDPVASDLQQEIKKFMIAMTEKYHIPITNLYLLQEASKINYFAKNLTERMGLPVTIFDLSPNITKNTVLSSMKLPPSTFISTIGGCYA